MRKLHEACTSLLSGFLLGPQDLQKVIYTIMTKLNTTPFAPLGNREDKTLRAPLDIMNGILPSRSYLPVNIGNISEVSNMETVRLQKIINIANYINQCKICTEMSVKLQNLIE